MPSQISSAPLSSHAPTSSTRGKHTLIVISNPKVKSILDKKVSVYDLKFRSLNDHEKLDKTDCEEIQAQIQENHTAFKKEKFPSRISQKLENYKRQHKKYMTEKNRNKKDEEFKRLMKIPQSLFDDELPSDQFELTFWLQKAFHSFHEYFYYDKSLRGKGLGETHYASHFINPIVCGAANLHHYNWQVGEKVIDASKEWAQRRGGKKKQGFKVDLIIRSKRTNLETLVGEYTKPEGVKKDKDIEKIIKEMQLTLDESINKARTQHFSQECLRTIRVFGIYVYHMEIKYFQMFLTKKGTYVLDELASFIVPNTVGDLDRDLIEGLEKTYALRATLMTQDLLWEAVEFSNGFKSRCSIHN